MNSKYLILIVILSLFSCKDIDVIIEKQIFERNLNLINKVPFSGFSYLKDSLNINFTKQLFTEISIDTLYLNKNDKINYLQGFQYYIDSGNFGVAKIFKKDSLHYIHFYNQMDLMTKENRATFTIYYFQEGSEYFILNTWDKSIHIY